MTATNRKVKNAQTAAARGKRAKSNPFNPQKKLIAFNQKNQLLKKNLHVPVSSRVKNIAKNTDIVEAINELKTRLGGDTYSQEHFGELKTIPIDKIDINTDIQRDLETSHIVSIIKLFDPRVMQPVNVTYFSDTDRYVAWDGQQSSAAYLLALQAGIIDPGVEIQCKVFDETLEVPGSDLIGEAAGNYGFRRLNGKGRKAIAPYFLHRSQANGARIYGSQLQEDLQSLEIDNILENNNCAAAPKGTSTPGKVSHISGMNKITGHDTDNFNTHKADLDNTLRFYDTYFPRSRGVDASFLMCFSHMYYLAREQGIDMSVAEPELADMIKNLYGTLSGLKKGYKERLSRFHEELNIKDSWNDQCTVPFLILDYMNYANATGIMPDDPYLNRYATAK